MPLDPLPLSHLLGPLPLERNVLYGRPLMILPIERSNAFVVFYVPQFIVLFVSTLYSWFEFLSLIISRVSLSSD